MAKWLHRNAIPPPVLEKTRVFLGVDVVGSVIDWNFGLGVWPVGLLGVFPVFPRGLAPPYCLPELDLFSVSP